MHNAPKHNDNVFSQPMQQIIVNLGSKLELYILLPATVPCHILACDKVSQCNALPATPVLIPHTKHSTSAVANVPHAPLLKYYYILTRQRGLSAYLLGDMKIRL